MLRSLLVSLVLVAACSAGAPATPSPAPPTGAPTAVPTAAPTVGPTAPPVASGSPYCDPEMTYGGCKTPGSGTPAPVGDLVVGLSQDGAYLVGPNGLALYTNDNDAPGSSVCQTGCVDNWPPLTVADEQAPEAGAGVSGELSAFDRGGDVYQVEYNGRPLYYYSGDTEPGHTRGDGLGEVWHLAAP